MKAKTQSKIRGILGDDFDYTKLDIIIKHFYGSEDNKKKMLLEQISKFLIESVGDDAYKNAVYNKIITDGLINASDRHYFTTKTKFVFNMVLPYLENVRITEEEIAGDPDSYDEAIENYQLFLGSLEADYGNISKILADYRMEKEKRSLSIPQYTIAFSERFIDLIPNNFSEQVRKELSRILVYRVLKQHHNLEKVKKVANIQ